MNGRKVEQKAYRVMSLGILTVGDCDDSASIFRSIGFILAFVVIMIIIKILITFCIYRRAKKKERDIGKHTP